MDIRTYRDKDLKSVILLWEECGLTVPWNDPQKDIRRKLSENPSLFFVGVVEHRVMATCMAGYDGHRGWIYYLAVKPEFQKQAHGRQLLQHAQEQLRLLGCPKINLMVRSSNSAVQKFYQSAGYLKESVTVLSKRLEDDTL